MRRLFQRLSRPLQWFVSCSLTLAGAFAFTLLVGVVIWKFADSRGKAKQPSCLSNLKQLSTGFLMYVQDFDDTWPVGTRNNRSGMLFHKDTPHQAQYHAGQGWAGVIYPYEKNVSVFQCPEDTAPKVQEMFPVSYAYNRNLALNVKSADLSAPRVIVLLAETEGNRANLRNADERNDEGVYSAAGNGLTILAATDQTKILDATGGARYVTGTLGEYGIAGCPLPPFAPAQTSKFRHENGANYAMADGHVKFHRPNSVSPGDNAENAGQAHDCNHRRAAGTRNMGAFAITFSTK